MRRLAWLVAAALLILSTTVSAQSHWSAEGAGMSVWVGAEISTFNPDYGCKNDSPFTCGSHQLLGVSPFVDANHVLFRRLGFEGQARILPWRGPGDGLSESSYMAGPKVSIARFRSVGFSGKFLAGGAHITLPGHAPGSGQYFAMAPGFIANMRVSRRVFARAEYEYQLWPNFLGGGGLTPNGFSFGFEYALKRY